MGRLHILYNLNIKKSSIIIISMLALMLAFYLQSIAWSQTYVCDNGICDPGETYENCPLDCRQPLTLLSTKGQRIINEKGHFINLRGFHFDCFSFLDKELHYIIKSAGDNPARLNAELSSYYCTDEDIKNIKDMGANVVKIGFGWWDIKDEAGGCNEIALAHLDSLIERFGRNGIYVILSLISGRQNSQVLSKEPGEPGFWDKDQGEAVREWLYIIWETIAERYSDSSFTPYIAGYNIVKEPGVPAKGDLHVFYEQAIQRIRAKDQRHIIFLEANIDQNTGEIDANVAWGGEYSGENISLNLSYKDNWNHYVYFTDTIFKLDEIKNKPLFVGNIYKYVWSGENNLRYIMDFFKDYHVSFAFCCYKSVDLTKVYSAYYKPNDETFAKMGQLYDDLYNGTIRIDDVDEATKELCLTKNFDSPLWLKSTLIEGFGGPICGNGICDAGEDIRSCLDDCSVEGFEGNRFGVITGGLLVESEEADFRGGVAFPAEGVGSTNAFREVGLDAVNISIFWQNLEPEKGVYSEGAWKRLDNSIDHWYEKDVTILATIYAASEWDARYRDCREKIREAIPTIANPPTMSYLYFPSSLPLPENMDAYKRFLEKLVTRYKGKVRYWQMENELDHAESFIPNAHDPELCGNVPSIISRSFWMGTQDEYLELLTMSSEIIKNIDPEAMVLPYGFCGFGYGNTLNDRILTEYREYYDILDIHTYQAPEDEVELITRMMRMNGVSNNISICPDKPIFVTEHGQISIQVHPEFKKTFDSPEELITQSEEIVKRHVLGFSAGAKKIFGLKLTDSGDNPGRLYSHMGLTFDMFGSNKKPGFYTIKLLIEKLKDFISVEKIDYGIYRFRFNDKAPVYVLWIDTGERQFDISDYVSHDTIRITHIETKLGTVLDDNGNPIYDEEIIPAVQELTITKTPIFAEEIVDEFNVNDDYPNSEDTDGDNEFRHIQAAIDASFDYDIIKVQPGIYYEKINYKGKAITIESSDHNHADATVIDADQGGSVVTFANNEQCRSVLRGFTIRGGESNNGGGIFCYESSPSIIKCRIENNRADFGAGVYCHESSPVITNCIINNNTASVSGGGIYCKVKSSPIFTNCTIAGNSGTNFGPLGTDNNNDENDSLPVITNCILWGNIPCETQDGLITVTYSNIELEQGLVYSGRGNINEYPLFKDPGSGDYQLLPGSSSIDKGNNAKSPDEDLNGLSRPQDGNKDREDICDLGAHEFPAYPIKTYYKDSDNDGYGDPGVSVEAYETPDGYVDNANDCHDYDPDINPGASEICDSKDNNCDGEFNEDLAGCTIPSQTYYVSNIYPETDDTDGDNKFRHIQAAIDESLPGYEIIVSPGLYKENINFHGKAITLRSTDPNNRSVVETTIIDGNQEANFINDQPVNVVSFDSGEDFGAVLSGFTLMKGHSGILCRNSSPYISNCIIKNNVLKKGDSEVESKGGGIYCHNSSPIITNCTISNNSAEDVNDPYPESTGSAIFCDSSSKPVISNCTISNNIFNHGAGIFCTESSPVVKNTCISNNLSCIGGGIVCWESCILTICNSNIENNEARARGSKGGGLYSYNSLIEIRECIFKNNIALSHGSRGGGIYLGKTTVNIYDSEINENVAAAAGGGLWSALSTINIYDSNIRRNLAYESGGGIRCDFSSASIINCDISYNGHNPRDPGAVVGAGGGILFYQCPPNINVLNSTLIINRAKIAGAIGCNNSSPVITNCTIAANKAMEDKDGDGIGDGGGIYCYYSSPIITNSILWGNKVNESDLSEEIFINNGSPIVSFSDVEVEQGSIYPGVSNINADPLFDLILADGHLLHGSPCIDAGTAENAPIADKDYVLRPQDGDGIGQALHDIGAFEYYEGPSLLTVYLDSDGDGYGDAESRFYDKGIRSGYVTNSNDCNDTDASVNPKAQEILDDGIDNNCNGEIDEGPPPCIFTAEITATGQILNDSNTVYHNTDTVAIGIGTYAMAEEAPPSLPDNTVLLTLAGDEYALKTDIRAAGAVQEEWQLRIVVGGPGSVADPNKPGYFPVLSWDPNLFCLPDPNIGYTELWSENPQGARTLLIVDMSQVSWYQTKKEDGVCTGGICVFTYYITWSLPIEVEMNFPAGWSMMSLPLRLDDPTPSGLFPEALVIYTYQKGAGYVRIHNDEDLQAGSGYWIFFHEDRNQVLTGRPINFYSKTVNESGWEMIGGCSSGARPTADSCDMGVIYRYRRGSGYQRIQDSEDLNPGEGFWILLKEVAGQCQITVEPTGDSSRFRACYANY